ncbi:alpha-L-fucosidase [Parabacteroides sp. FAFU027]|uniref:alpha-L-fucosidase n=1 Tax=Parabacteroides sp. FAFU027 TaxID=2922715 RepID=UPI001FAFB6BC|nr:alpha-L-fucosidase [Parabacteroides sp. FAFU027]
MKTKLLSIICVLSSFCLQAQENKPIIVQTDSEPVAKGKFEPTWQSLSQYKVPEWFRNAKFGIWAHWGPACQAEQGDWFARFMYNEGSDEYKWFVTHYGHPSKVGFKDVIHNWKGQNWEPDKLVALYKRVGAQYFFAMANHHDNLDMWNSKYQEWNTLRVGPGKDIIAGWAKAAKNQGLPFGLSVHAAHTWTWFETSQWSDKKGEFAGIPYDGKLTKADGKGTWWEGLDPQELYEQNHPLSAGNDNIESIWKPVFDEATKTWRRQWDWENGASIPSQKYCEKFYNRTMDLINQFNPDLLYFDDDGLPLYQISDAGLKLATHFYNHNMATHKGKLEGVLFGKKLTAEQKKCLVWDVERGATNKIESAPWQTCTCIGDWHYNRAFYEQNRYKSAATVIRMLVDIVSKNGNMLLNIPVRGDGSIDDKEVVILDGIAAWMDVNKESIFDTRPWNVYGEGPSVEAAGSKVVEGFNEGNAKLNSKDIRFARKGNVVYATVMGVPAENISLKSLAKNGGALKIKNIEMLGSNEKLSWEQNPESLVIRKPNRIPNNIAVVFKIQTR